MGTRADFYIGKGKNAKWLGSIAWDGYPEGIPDDIRKSTNIKTYENLVKTFISSREDGTEPSMGWPWPWDTSALTDYTYFFYDNKVRYTSFCKGTSFPNMKTY